MGSDAGAGCSGCTEDDKEQDVDDFVTITEYDALYPPKPRSVPRLRADASEVLILVMASRDLEERAALVDEAWSGSAVQYLFLVDDWLRTVPRSRQWLAHGIDPPLSSPGLGAEEGTALGSASSSGYWSAQSRQLEYMRTHPTAAAASAGLSANVSWVILVDDDTWVHLDRLLGFLADRDPAAPVLFTYVLSDAHVLAYDYPCGGAGMLLSASAYEMIAPWLLTDTCPYLSYNDMTLGYCAHSMGVPVVHHPNMHCSPDMNRAMRLGENLLDLQRVISIHRLPAFGNFSDLVYSVSTLQGQLQALLEHQCKLVPRGRTEGLDSRRFFWAADAFPDAVAACRLGLSMPAPREAPLHLEFLMFGGGVPVARYHHERHIPFVADPDSRSARWPEWLEELRHLRCTGHADTWRAHWLAAAPRVARRQVDAMDLGQVAAAAGVTVSALTASFERLQKRAPRGSWLEELQRRARAMKAKRLSRVGPGRTWLFLDFAPASTFVNVFEAATALRALSDLYRSGRGERRPYARDVHEPVDLADLAPPPLAIAYEYFDFHVEHEAGVWLNGVAVERLTHCPPLHQAPALNEEVHANDWETEQERLALLWHNALAVDVFQTLRFCGVILLHSPQMVPHALTYLPYSTFRRPHAPSVATALSLGNVLSREQIHSMALLVRRRACRPRRHCDARPGSRRRCSWQPRFRMRAVTQQMGLEQRRGSWSFPRARFMGMSLVAFRSEHFLPDAQAAGPALWDAAGPR